MANETKYFVGTPKTLEANGAAIANNDVGQANDFTYSTATDGGGYPDAEFVLGFTFSVAPIENSVLALYARPINIDGTADSEAPESGATAYKGSHYIGNFYVNNVTTLQTALCVGYRVPREAEYYIFNSATGQSVSAGWTLKVTPRTLGPA